MDIPEETRIETTPSGKHTIVLRNFLTGADRRASRKLILQLAADGKDKTSDALDAAEDALIKQVILELDGSKEEIVERVVKMHVTDYEFVLSLVQQVATGDDKKKVTSSGSTPTSSTQGQ